MAVSASNLTSGTDTDGGTSAVTASVSPSSGKLILLSVSSRTNITADPNQPTVTGNSLTWVAVNTIIYDTTSSTRKRLTLFRAMGTPSSGTATIDFGGQTQTGMEWTIDEFTGMDTTGTNGSGAIVQSVTNKDETSSNSTLTVTLAAFSSVDNATYGCLAIDGTFSSTQGSGFTKLGGALGNNSVISEFNNANDTTVDASFSNTGLLGGIAVEIKASGGGAASVKQLAALGVG